MSLSDKKVTKPVPTYRVHRDRVAMRKLLDTMLNATREPAPSTHPVRFMTWNDLVFNGLVDPDTPEGGL